MAAGEAYDRWLVERFGGAENAVWRPVGPDEARQLTARSRIVLPPGLPALELHFAMRAYADETGLVRRTLCLVDPALWRLLCRHALCGIRTFQDEIEWEAPTTEWRRVCDFDIAVQSAVREAA